MSKIGDKYLLPKDHPQVVFFGHEPGEYTIEVGAYGWEDGDLFIKTNKGKLKLRDLR